jgi:bisphosphoglycerate-independent phosphoglycerate mutase (AlkP superfamily)
MNPLTQPAAPGNGVAAPTEGTLADVAPTVLALLGIQPPSAMSGRSLLERSGLADPQIALA